MRFDWARFVKERAIPYVTQGPNTARNNWSIKCPWCGTADNSQHMGLSLNVNDPTFGCWRNQKHRGRDPAFLIAKLLVITPAQAERIVTAQGQNPDDFESTLASLQAPPAQEVRQPKRTLLYPKEFREFRFPQTFNTQNYFTDYLYSRGFPNMKEVIQHFKLRWAITGEYKHRIIIPVIEEGTLCTWTARAINKTANVRYRSLEADRSIINIKDSLLYVPWRPAKRLIITEGPFDAIKLETYGVGVNATCIFGLTMSEQQMVKLSRLAQNYLQVVVMLDSTARAEGDRMVSQLIELTGKRIIHARLPAGVSDPGILSARQVQEVTAKLGG